MRKQAKAHTRIQHIPVADESFPKRERVRGRVDAAVRARREAHVHVISEGQELRLQTHAHADEIIGRAEGGDAAMSEVAMLL